VLGFVWCGVLLFKFFAGFSCAQTAAQAAVDEERLCVSSTLAAISLSAEAIAAVACIGVFNRGERNATAFVGLLKANVSMANVSVVPQPISEGFGVKSAGTSVAVAPSAP